MSAFDEAQMNARAKDGMNAEEELKKLMDEQTREDFNNAVDKILGINPKDAIGATKPDLSLNPPAGIIHMARAMGNGALKYGPFNWRAADKKVQARTYVAAALRHLLAWQDGEEIAEDSGVHHLGHAMACCAILLDAQENGFLADNRPAAGNTAALIKKFTVKKS